MVLGNYKAQTRAAVFEHLAGLVLAPTVRALDERGILDPLADCSDGVEFNRMVEFSRANRGYLRVALRLLVACGWLSRVADRYSITEAGAIALPCAPEQYRRGLELTSSPDREEEAASALRERWFAISGTDEISLTIQNRIRAHLDGLVVAPVMVWLARSGLLAQFENEGLDLSLQEESSRLRAALHALETLGWIRSDSGVARLTTCGAYAAQIATSYGVTVSYLPLLGHVEDLLFADAQLGRVDASGDEVLVDRAMNVWGSGGAHRTYFKKIDQILIDIFNRPIESQPRGICDMGCGDGTFLEHLYKVVRDRTERGRILAERPLMMIGADFNQMARGITEETLRLAEIPGFAVIPGDINEPALLAQEMQRLRMDISDFLHVRSFLDHNRPYLPSPGYQPGTRPVRSSGAFAHLGEEVPADELEENLVRHLRHWVPHIGRFGLLALELHTLPPELTALHQDQTPAIAYDGTHGYSDQYLVELPIFLECAREAGLTADPRYQTQFPPSEFATVSVNLFVHHKN